ncbi:MAG: hypothetical protein SGI92_33735, partial [Bryobacteraceae bacterium]|nr:hypothetical protein [Bryobacteraceae bacterium]
MVSIRFLPLFLLVATLSAAGTLSPAQKRTVQQMGTRPILFSPVQTEGREYWLSSGPGYFFAINPDRSLIRVAGSTGTADVSMRFRGARPGRTSGQDPAATILNTLKGNDPAKWSTGKRTWQRVRREGLYPGVDVVYYGNQQRLEYDVVVHPGGSPSSVEVEFEGASGIRLAADGSLRLTTSAGELSWHAPVAWQEAGGRKKPVPVRYELASSRSVRFVTGAYDEDHDLVIDPVFTFSRLYGGAGGEQFGGLAVDALGNAYLAGVTFSPDFPLVNPLASGSAANGDGYVMKIDPSGNILWSSVIGGADADTFWGLAVDSTGAVYVAGDTYSSDFPRTTGPATLAGANGVVLKISPQGNQLVFSRLLGGSGVDTAYAILPAQDGSIFVGGSTTSTDFPLVSAFRSTRSGQDGFLTKLSSTGEVTASTFFGGNSVDLVQSLATAPNGELWFTANTNSSDIASAGLRTTYGGNGDCFVGRTNAALTALVYGSYLGGSSSDSCSRIQVDS